MCGINGFFAQDSIGDIEMRITKMNNSLIHRGPDAEGFHIYAGGRVAVGQRRLSIIDTQSRSNQPMVSASGMWSIVFNGEIYNYQELKQKTSYPYRTSSDTEVILAYVEEFGLDQFLHDCNGMFAFCLYNTVEHHMFIARDRLGIKPLYYYFDEKKFIFSSEIKGVLASGFVEAKLKEDAIDEFLGNRYVRAPFTFFERIYQLEPGQKIFVDCNKFPVFPDAAKYWNLPSAFHYNQKYCEDELLEAFADELNKAIQRRLVSDVPLGTYLSGGVDSSLITAITAENLNHPFDTYTIGFPELNEFPYAELVAKKYKTNHHQILINSGDYFQHLKKVISYKDAPLGVPNEIPLALMSIELKKKITVVLSGEGADELLGGYGKIYRSAFDYENHFKDSTEFFDYFTGLYEYVPRKMRDTYLKTGSAFREVFDGKIKREFSSCRNEENIFRYFHQYHVQGLLQRVDTTTMLASVEARVPFLDHKLIEFCYNSIPYDLKLRWKDEKSYIKASQTFSHEYSEACDTPKYLLKQLAYRYLPKEVIERKKVGFPVPLNAWRKQLESLARSLLIEAPWLKTELLEELLLECENNTRAGQILWMFISFELFRTMYFEKSWRY